VALAENVAGGGRGGATVGLVGKANDGVVADAVAGEVDSFLSQGCHTSAVTAATTVTAPAAAIAGHSFRRGFDGDETTRA
jgi:hypothetical protein